MVPADCPHVVVVVGFVCFDDPWGYAVELLMPDRPIVRIQTKRDEGFTPCGRSRSLPDVTANVPAMAILRCNVQPGHGSI